MRSIYNIYIYYNKQMQYTLYTADGKCVKYDFTNKKITDVEKPFGEFGEIEKFDNYIVDGKICNFDNKNKILNFIFILFTIIFKIPYYLCKIPYYVYVPLCFIILKYINFCRKTNINNNGTSSILNNQLIEFNSQFEQRELVERPRNFTCKGDFIDSIEKEYYKRLELYHPYKIDRPDEVNFRLDGSDSRVDNNKNLNEYPANNIKDEIIYYSSNENNKKEYGKSIENMYYEKLKEYGLTDKKPFNKNETETINLTCLNEISNNEINNNENNINI